MDFWRALQFIPPVDVAAMLGAMAVMFGLVILFRRLGGARERRMEAPATFGGRLVRAALHVGRLAALAVLSFVLIAGAVMAAESHRAVAAYIAPTPSAVEVPADLPFAVEDVRFEGGDGLRLAAWYVPSENGAAVILLHGYGANRLMMRWHAERLVAAGYGVLMVDGRASGESEGNRRSYGWEDVPDVGGAIDYLRGRAAVDPDRIGVLGCSIGGQVALRAAAVYPAIGAVWADGPSRVTAEDIPPAEGNWKIGLTTFSGRMMDRMLAARLGVPLPSPMVDTVGEIAPHPVMLAAGGSAPPGYAPESWQVGHYFDHADEGAEMWVIQGATHCDGYLTQPDEYTRRMIGFFDAALLGE